MDSRPSRLSRSSFRSAAAALAAALWAWSAAPAASAQTLFMDVNGDGRGDASDVLGPEVTSVDIYLDTAHDAAGAAAVCQNGQEGENVLTICSYTFILEWDPAGSGSVSYGPWSDNMGFTVPAGGMESGRMFWIARAAPYFLAPGRYMLGSLKVKVTGAPILRFLSSTPLDNTAMTSFGAQCGGRDYDNTMKLGSDFLDARGTSLEDEGPGTVWGTLKRLYR
jgi:hypothetical protein